MNNDILSFWEPKAPNFQKRRQSLQFAFESGFRTSASIEPMLESYTTIALVNNTLSFVNDAIWSGKMNHLGRLKKNADEVLTSRIAEIEQGQTDARIWSIYNQFKDKPKLKWKDSIKKVVWLEAPPKPGMVV